MAVWKRGSQELDAGQQYLVSHVYISKGPKVVPLVFVPKLRSQSKVFFFFANPCFSLLSHPIFVRLF